ncbi:hypothetical protein BGW36DRAFT_299157 [Talaromyces proteolyticus]|uniref:Small ribosomal subunit protein mS38 n=1 Tax=Talaromyces proteolyticus TaxID=1131652 RepID=A0AAD4KNI4_9EURO|nr:uncharacterized protein BGW36DRAFT_299157 [Talaromyces proteolyticus]KAH8695557.1 hypothetical protein BGW36DRAFT_299157 [Talaromyces proteolyticus]
MLLSSLRRAVRTPTPFPSLILPSASSANGLLLSATSQRRAHQRRYSSSKPPAPPNDGSRPFDTPSSQAPSGKNVGPAEREGEQRKATKRKGKDNSTSNGRNNHPSPFLNVPSVPSTHHLLPQDMHLASFFSLHRPISVTTTIPPPTNEEAFNAIFESKSMSRRGRGDVLDTLSSAVRSMENATRGGNFTTQASSSIGNGDMDVIHLDGVSEEDLHNSIGEFAKRLAPFNPPAAPEPFNEEEGLVANSAEQEAEDSSLRTYSTVLTIRESVHPDGHKTYEAHVSPLVSEDMEAPGSINADFEDPNTNNLVRNSYIERVYNNKMQAISVRRQRKLKMKKHKFKKLLRKTRTLRRKLDKA